MKRLFFGGRIVRQDQIIEADLLTDGEKIAAIGKDLEAEGAEVIDVRGKLLFPGFIDAHTHMDLEVSDTVTADDFYTGTKAELAGGTTCILDFATQNKGETLHYALEQWHKKAKGKASCDYAFHLALSDWNEEVSKELEEIVAEGIHSFKLYMTYDAMVMDDQSIYEILVRLKELGGIAGVHCENKGIIDARLKETEKKKGHRRDVSDYPGTRPALAEAEAISRLLKIARCAQAPVIIVHLSSKEGYAEIQRAKQDGQEVYVETCPQYLLLDDSRYVSGNEGRKYMIAPPLRKKEDQEALWKALGADELNTVCTDHCSFTSEQKKMGEKDFSKTPCGMQGAEERPALMYHFGVGSGRISLQQMCRYLSEQQAKLYHLFPKKGILAPGSDADLVVWNPDTEWTMTAASQQANTDYCPMEGTKIRGRAERVYLRGVLAAENGKIVKERMGKYIAGRELQM